MLFFQALEQYQEGNDLLDLKDYLSAKFLQNIIDDLANDIIDEGIYVEKRYRYLQI